MEGISKEATESSSIQNQAAPHVHGQHLPRGYLVGGQNVPAVGSASMLNSTNGLAIVVDVLVVRLGVVRTVVVVVGRGVVVVVVEVVVVGIRISVPGE